MNSMIKTYIELRAQQSEKITHRILGDSKNQNGEYILTIQVIGKAVTFKASPKEILADDQLLESFSKKDIRLLTYLACENIKEPVHEILEQKFVRAMNKFFFKIKHGKTGEEIEKSAEEISTDLNLIKSLTPEDAHKVGFVTANEMIKEERRQQL